MALVDSVSKYTLTFGATDLQKSTSLSGVTTAANCVPFFTSRVTTLATGDNLQSYTIDCYISGTNVVADRADDAAGELVVEVGVVEFGSDATVQSGTFTIADLATSGTANPTVSAANLSKTFCVFSWESPVTGEMNSSSVWHALTENTLTFNRFGINNALGGHWYTVTDDESNFTVQRDTAIDMSSGSGTDTLADTTITAVAYDKGMLIASWGMTQTAKDPDDMPNAYLFDSDTGGDYDTVRFQRFSGGGSATASFEAVTFTDSTNVESGLLTQTSQTASDTVTITLAVGDVDDAIAFGNMSSLAHGSTSSGTSAYMADSHMAYTLSTNTLTAQRYAGAAGPTDFDYPWQVVTWDIGGAPPPTRRVMVIS